MCRYVFLIHNNIISNDVKTTHDHSKLENREQTATHMRSLIMFYIVLHCVDASQLLLEVNSIHPNLHLSEGNRTVTMKNDPKNYPDHPERFDHWQQVRIY